MAWMSNCTSYDAYTDTWMYERNYLFASWSELLYVIIDSLCYFQSMTTINRHQGTHGERVYIPSFR